VWVRARHREGGGEIEGGVTDLGERLTAGFVDWQVGAQTETELKEKKLRVEDALNATKVRQLRPDCNADVQSCSESVILEASRC
jgi:hypothetical protein